MVYFISDLHLGAKYIADHRAHEARVTAFLDAIADDATELYLLGDVLDYWFEYRNAVPRGHIRFFGGLSRLADRGVRITWLTGNHDIWLFDYLRNEIGIEVVDAPYIVREIGGKRFILAHGDRIGKAKPSFRFICSLFRNKFCQKLYSGIHPRWTIPFALCWSSSSRGAGKAFDPESQLDRIITQVTTLPLNDIKPDYVVMGHYHVDIDTAIPDSAARLIVLGDWINRDTYACFDGTSMMLENFNSDTAFLNKND